MGSASGHSEVKSLNKNRPTLAKVFALARRFTRPEVDHVSFVVAGVQKAGTTAIHDFLAQHPQIALLRDQALHFFDKEENFAGQPDYQTLLANFDPGRNWQAAGEVTADYLYYSRALERIAACNPKMKIIISLRDPTERAFSQWNMRREKNQEPLEFLDALKSDLGIGISKGPRGNAYVARSLYFPQLEKVFALFPRDQVYVLKYEVFRSEAFSIANEVFEFLGLERRSRLKNRQRNVGSYARKLTAEERKFGHTIFEEDVNKVEALLGWDCSDWRLKAPVLAVA